MPATSGSELTGAELLRDRKGTAGSSQGCPPLPPLLVWSVIYGAKGSLGPTVADEVSDSRRSDRQMAPEASGLRLQSPSSSRPQTWKRRRNVQKTMSRRLQALHKGRSERRPLQRVPSATDNAKTGRAVQPVSRRPPKRTKERPFSRDYHQLAGSQSNTAELERGVSSKSGGEELLEALGIIEHPRRCPDVPLGDSQPRCRYLASGPSPVHETGCLESAS